MFSGEKFGRLVDTLPKYTTTDADFVREFEC